MTRVNRAAPCLFQSTLPVRGATAYRWQHVGDIKNFNPRSPCGERPSVVDNVAVTVEFQSTLPVRGATKMARAYNVSDSISIHAPRAGSDAPTRRLHHLRVYFNPRSPCGERRHSGLFRPCQAPISIHAPRAGSDICGTEASQCSKDFNPRSPCGERRLPH